MIGELCPRISRGAVSSRGNMKNLLENLVKTRRLKAIAAVFAEARIIELSALGVERSVAQAAVDALRGKTIINEATGIRARLSSSARGKLVSNKATGKSKEAIKLEALDRIVEVVSGNTPHASSAPTRSMVAFFSSCVNAVFGKISTHRSLLAAAAVAFLLLFPLPSSLSPLSLFAAKQLSTRQLVFALAFLRVPEASLSATRQQVSPRPMAFRSNSTMQLLRVSPRSTRQPP